MDVSTAGAETTHVWQHRLTRQRVRIYETDPARKMTVCSRGLEKVCAPAAVTLSRRLALLCSPSNASFFCFPVIVAAHGLLPLAGARGPDGDAGARRRCGRLPPAPCSSSKATHRLRGSGTAATVGGGRYQTASQGGRYPAVSREGRGSDGFATMSGWLGSPEANASTHRRAARPR